MSGSFSTPLISLRNVGVRYMLKTAGAKRRPFWALEDVSAEVYKGESLGIIGRNSAGKTTLLQLLAQIIAPDRGEVRRTPGVETALLSLQVGFIPHLTGRENAILSGLLLGLHKRQIEERLDRIVGFAELEEFIDQPMHTYSAGMRARLGFSVAFQLEPDILLIDEVLSAGDWEFRKKSAREMRRKIRSDKTIVLVSHNPKTLRDLCDRAIWLEDGVIRATGETEAVLEEYEDHLRKVRRRARIEPAAAASQAADDAPGAAATASPTAAAGLARQRPRPLFVMGCERSGTTALMRQLNSDPRIVLGRERFKFIVESLGPEHLEEQRFFDVKPEETNFDDVAFYQPLRERWQAGGVSYVGDKNPRYYDHLPHLVEAFPDCKIVFTVRDLYRVASSYNVRAQREDDPWPHHKDYRTAVKDWNRSLSLVRKFILRHGPERVFLVEHEQFFSGRMAYLERLYAFLDLPIEQAPRESFAKLARDWQQIRGKELQLTHEMIEHLERERDRFLEVWCLQACPRL